MGDDSSKRESDHKVVDLDSRRRGPSPEAKRLFKLAAQATARHAAIAKERGDELPNTYDLGELQFAYVRRGPVEAASLVAALNLALFGTDRLLLNKLVGACEAVLFVNRQKTGRPASKRERLYYLLCNDGPRIGTESFEQVADAAVRGIRNVLGAEYDATIAAVRKACRNKADHNCVIRACFRACRVPGANNLGKAKIVKRARSIRAKRKK